MSEPEPLIALLLASQRESWEQGDCVPVEAFLHQHPSLQEDTDSLLDLIYNEVFLREQKGEAPRSDEYLLRFPDLADSIGAQFEVHQAIQTYSDAENSLLAPAGPGQQIQAGLSLYSTTTGEVIAITNATTVIGRSAECDVVLKKSGVSRRHCKIVRTPEQVIVEDLGSVQGTRLNGLPVARVQLRDGDRLELAGQLFVVRLLQKDQ